MNGDKKPKRKKWIILGIAFAVIVAGVGTWFFTRPAPVQEARQFTAKAERANQAKTIALSGALSPQKQAGLNFSVSGTVTKVYVKAGDSVKKGDKLAKVDATDLKNAVAMAKADLKAAQASYTDSKSDSSAARTAAAARVDSAKASLKKAESDLANAVLRSTITGTVASVNLGVGDQITSGGGGAEMSTESNDQVLVIATATWKLEGTVSAADLPSVKPGQKAVITLDSYVGQIAGKVETVGIVASASSDGTAGFPIVVALDGKNPELYSGTSADAVITILEREDVLTVPTVAITNSAGKTFVTIVKGAELTPAEVTLGEVFGEKTEILTGVSEGDEVVVPLVAGRTASGRTDADPGIQMGGPVFGGGMSGPANRESVVRIDSEGSGRANR